MTSKIRPVSFLLILILSLTITLVLGDGISPTPAFAEGGWGGCEGDTCPPDTLPGGQRMSEPTVFERIWEEITALF